MHHMCPNKFNDPQTQRINLSLCVYSNLIPSEISSRLNLLPDRSSETPRKSKPKDVLWKNHLGLYVWIWETEDKTPSKDIRDHIDMLCDALRPAQSELAKLQSEDNMTITVMASVWTSGGVVLWPEQMKALSELDLELQFAVIDYTPEDDVDSITG